MKLSYDVVQAPGSAPTRAVAFLHGILGSGANLRGHAKKFVEAHPDWLAVLFDLRAHGHSLDVDGADSLEHAAADVYFTAKSLPLPLEAVVGHSFGGKVALQLAQDHDVKQLVTLDSAPGPRLDARGSESTLAVIELLESLHDHAWETRDHFIRDIEQGGQSRSLGQWLATNLDRRADGLRFRLDLRRIRALLGSYFAADLWSVIEHSQCQVHLVIGTKSQVYSSADRARAEQLEQDTHGRVTVDLLDAGHWVHVEDPDGVTRVLVDRLT